MNSIAQHKGKLAFTLNYIQVLPKAGFPAFAVLLNIWKKYLLLFQLHSFSPSLTIFQCASEPKPPHFAPLCCRPLSMHTKVLAAPSPPANPLCFFVAKVDYEICGFTGSSCEPFLSWDPLFDVVGSLWPGLSRGLWMYFAVWRAKGKQGWLQKSYKRVWKPGTLCFQGT